MIISLGHRYFYTEKCVFGAPVLFEILSEERTIKLAKENGRKNTRQTRSIGDKTVTEYLIDKREAEARTAQERLEFK